jgi:hypothetical protein
MDTYGIVVDMEIFFLYFFKLLTVIMYGTGSSTLTCMSLQCMMISMR